MRSTTAMSCEMNRKASPISARRRIIRLTTRALTDHRLHPPWRRKPRREKGKQEEPAMIANSRTVLRDLFVAAVAAASPASCVPPNLPPRPRGRTIVVGAGKAAAAMAAAVEHHWD